MKIYRMTVVCALGLWLAATAICSAASETKLRLPFVLRLDAARPVAVEITPPLMCAAVGESELPLAIALGLDVAEPIEVEPPRY